MLQLTIREDLSEIIHYTSPDIPVSSLALRLDQFINHTTDCHWHEDLEFTIVTEGTMSYFVNDVACRLSKGMGIFVNSNRLHFNGPGAKSSHDCRYTCLLLHPSLLRGNAHIESRFVDPFLYDIGRDALVLSPETGWQRRVLSCLTALARMAREQPDGYELRLQSQFFFLCSLFYKNTSVETGLPAGRSELMKSIKNMIGFIHVHYAEKITLDDIAASGMMCRSKCCRLFKQILRQTIFEYLLRYRIRKSINLLANTGMSITEIAGYCGFNSASYYTEVFNKTTGMAPRDYRTRNRFKKNPAFPI
ncbi:MAG: AraC family transcriptional regulator [Treponema sp.]|jgi:AraC-like DNA-binding protein|nr:AraC family transcriptional regulator [Treponema sp.]